MDDLSGRESVSPGVSLVFFTQGPGLPFVYLVWSNTGKGKPQIRVDD